MIAYLVLCLQAKPAVELPTEPKARKVFEAMLSAYATCKTYQDTGVAQAGEERIPFKTFYSRPNHLYVEFTSLVDKSRRVLWCNGGKPTKAGSHEPGYLESYYWDSSDGTIETDDLEMSLAGATGVSLGGGSTVPGFLFPDKAYGIAYKQAKDFVQEGQELCNGQACDVLSSKEWFLKIWVSQKLHVMMREDTEIEGNKFRIDFDPVLEKTIPTSQYDFKPPKKK